MCLPRKKLALFEVFASKNRNRIKLQFSEHPGLIHQMSASWMADMRAWLPDAVEELKVLLRRKRVEWVVTRIGSVGAELELHGKQTRIFLYWMDKVENVWHIVLEALPIGEGTVFSGGGC